MANSSKYNDIAGNVNMKKNIIDKINAVNKIREDLLVESLGLTDVPADLKSQINKSDNEFFFLRKALLTSDLVVSQKIINFIEKNDISSLTIEECEKILEDFNNSNIERVRVSPKDIAEASIESEITESEIKSPILTNEKKEEKGEISD